MKKIISLITILGLVLMLSNNEASASSTDYIYSVKNYTEYLQDKSNEPNAQNILDQFLSLSPKDQQLFVEALKPENFFAILDEAQKNKNNEIAISLNTNPGEKVQAELSLNSSDDIGLSETTYRVTTPWATSTFSLLGIQMAQYKVKIIYQSDGTNALQVYDVEKDHYNYNPTVWTTDNGFTAQYVSGGWAFGGYSWTFNSTGSLGAISFSFDKYIKAKPGSREYKINSGRSDWALDWTAF